MTEDTQDTYYTCCVHIYSDVS